MFLLPLRPLSAGYQYTKTGPVVATGEIVEISSQVGLVTVYFFILGSYIPLSLIGPFVAAGEIVEYLLLGGISYCVFFSSGS